MGNQVSSPARVYKAVKANNLTELQVSVHPAPGGLTHRPVDVMRMLQQFEGRNPGRLAHAAPGSALLCSIHSNCAIRSLAPAWMLLRAASTLSGPTQRGARR